MATPARFLKQATMILIATLLLAACAPAATPTVEPVPTEALAAVSSTDAPAPEPTETSAPEPTQATTPQELILATTTSTQDSGLLEYLLPDFEQEFNVKINVIAVGSGQALQMGEDGDADVLLVHSPAAEKTFMEEKYGV
ncbi:MAG TPA: substrate-binding domain-containing protein, partial [Anaerolineaceae bacterium]|nr:substrate-binding domain-containing protein [Anaerolineaceae bacterium]